MLPESVIKNAIFLFVSKLIPALLLTLSTIVFARYLPVNEYGIYQSVWSYVNIGIVISTFGIPKYILTFGNHNKAAIRKIIFQVLFFTISLSGAYILFYHDHLMLNERLFVIGILLSQAIYFIQEANLVRVNQNKRLLRSNFIYAILLFLAQMYIVFVVNYTLEFSLIAILIVSIIRNVIVFSSNKSVEIDDEFLPINYKQLAWFGLYDVLQVLSKWLDKLVLLLFLTPRDFAIYFNGTYEIPLIGMLLYVFQSIITVHSADKSLNDKEQVEIFKNSSYLMSGILFPLAAFSVIFSNEIITVIFDSLYQESVILFAISALVIPLRICNFSVMLQIKEKGQIITIGLILAFLSILGLMLILYPYLELEGLALSVVIGTYILAGFYTYHIIKVFNTSISQLFAIDKLLVRFVVCFGIMAGIKFLIPLNNDYNFYLGIIVFLVLTSVYMSFLWKSIFKVKK